MSVYLKEKILLMLVNLFQWVKSLLYGARIFGAASGFVIKIGPRSAGWMPVARDRDSRGSLGS